MATESEFEKDCSDVLDRLLDNQSDRASEMIRELKLKYTKNLTEEIEWSFLTIERMIPELKKGKDILVYLDERIDETKMTKGYDYRMLIEMQLDVKLKQYERNKRGVRISEGKR